MQEISKEKNNPDILKKTIEKDDERNTTTFKLTNVTYNSITNNIPKNIKIQQDLQLEKDLPINNIKNIMELKEKERLEQEILYKPIKHKINVIDNKPNTISNNFTELKNNQENFLSIQKNNIIIKQNKYENIINDLKGLGILVQKK